MHNKAEFQQLLGKARDARRGGQDSWSVQSTGEKLAVAMVLNKPEWLATMGYSIPEAISRVGQEWVSMIPDVAKQLASEQDDT